MRFVAVIHVILLLLLTNLTSCTPKSTRVPSSVDLNNLAQEIAENGWEAIHDSQKSELLILRDNMIRYILHASYKSDEEKIKIVRDAQTYFNKASSQIMDNIYTIETNGDSELFKLKKAPSWTVESEVEFLNKSLKEVPLPKIGANFNSILEVISNLDPNILNQWKTSNSQMKEKSFNFLRHMSNSSNNEDKILKSLNVAEEEIDEYITQFKNAAKKLSESEDIKFNQPFWEKSVKEFINDYYDQADIDIFKNMLSDSMKLGHRPSEEEAIQIIFNNSGPGLGKTLQQIGREQGMGDALAEMMSKLESEGKPVPPDLALQIIRSDPGGYKFVHIDPFPVGTGTVAQVHRAIILRDGEEIEVAVRFLKPGIEKRASADMKILGNVFERMKKDSSVVGMEVPDLDKLLKTLDEFLKADMNIPLTLENHRIAKDVYSKIIKTKLESNSYLIDFNVPKLYEPSQNLDSTKLVVTEFIGEGTKFSEVTDETAKKVAAQQITKLWVDEALFRSGYTHADLHEGNFKVLLSEDGKKIKITFFDFGMNIKITKETKRAFILIGAGAAYNDPKLIAKSLLLFGNNESNLSYKELTRVIKDELVKNGKKDQAEWVTWGIKNGFKIPDDLGVLTRGGALVNQLPNAVKMGGIEVKFVEQFAVKHKVFRFMNLENDYPLKNIDLLHVGTSMLKSKCSDILTKIFKRSK